MSGPAAISVAIPTCDRPEELTQCLMSLSRVRYRNWDLILVDQSDGDEVRHRAMAMSFLFPKLTYIHLDQKNASLARNAAIGCAAGEVLAFIDDDCTVSPDWLDRVNETFERQRDAALIYGTVIPVEHDSAAAFVPAYDVQRERRISGATGALRVRAMGASMYMRLDHVGQPDFDRFLGPGSKFRSSQDWDYAYRVLGAGHVVAETPNIVVTHHGARAYVGGEAKAKMHDYLFGIGASHAKLLRCGYWIMVAVITAKLVGTFALVRPQNLLIRQPTHFGRLLMYVRGLSAGLRAPIDRREQVFC